jgi:hypothetical protein
MSQILEYPFIADQLRSLIAFSFPLRAQPLPSLSTSNSRNRHDNRETRRIRGGKSDLCCLDLQKPSPHRPLQIFLELEEESERRALEAEGIVLSPDVTTSVCAPLRFCAAYMSMILVCLPYLCLLTARLMQIILVDGDHAHRLSTSLCFPAMRPGLPG